MKKNVLTSRRKDGKISDPLAITASTTEGSVSDPNPVQLTTRRSQSRPFEKGYHVSVLVSIHRGKNDLKLSVRAYEISRKDGCPIFDTVLYR
jgi:hypothetical protein